MPGVFFIVVALAEPVVFDGRNLWEPDVVAERGLRYVSVGRPAALPVPAMAMNPEEELECVF